MPAVERVARPALEVEGLFCRYPDSRHWVLPKLSFTVRRGETLLILGPSGCGKSTLALCCKGLIPYTIEAEVRGRILFEGRKVTSAAPGAESTTRAGMVFQDPEAQLVMPRVDDEVAFGLENCGFPSERMGSRIVSALLEVGLGRERSHWVDTLSGGQKQRLALGAVLAMAPTLLILDEPTANLDPRGSSRFFATLARLKKERKPTILLIEHRIDQVMPLVDRVLVLNRRGQIVACGRPRQVFAGDTSRLEREGIWLPTPVRLSAELRRHRLFTGPTPLYLDESEQVFGALIGKDRRSRSTDQEGAPSLQEHRVAARLQHPSGGEPGPRRPAFCPPALRSGKPVVELEGVHYTYPRGARALRGVTLSVEQNSFLALVGANGSGKSTLARLLCGLLLPQSGSACLMGRPLHRLSSAQLVRTIGYVFQNPEHQFVTEKVRDEIAYSLKRHIPGQEQVARRIERLLRTFALKGCEEANPFSLSQGQKRRLSVATMIALEQPILILDEPTFGQDMASARALMKLVKDLHQRGTTIVFITHDMHLVLKYAEETAVMNEGEIVFRGTPAELFGNEAVLEYASLVPPFEVLLGRRLGDTLLFAGKDWIRRLTEQISGAAGWR